MCSGICHVFRHVFRHMRVTCETRTMRVNTWVYNCSFGGQASNSLVLPPASTRSSRSKTHVLSRPTSCQELLLPMYRICGASAQVPYMQTRTCGYPPVGTQCGWASVWVSLVGTPVSSAVHAARQADVPVAASAGSDGTVAGVCEQVHYVGLQPSRLLWPRRRTNFA